MRCIKDSPPVPIPAIPSPQIMGNNPPIGAGTAFLGEEHSHDNVIIEGSSLYNVTLPFCMCTPVLFHVPDTGTEQKQGADSYSKGRAEDLRHLNLLRHSGCNGIDQPHIWNQQWTSHTTGHR